MGRFLSALAVALVAFAVLGGAANARPADRVFLVPLSGGQEVPERDTRAVGLALFRVTHFDPELRYHIVVARIENVVAAHIHCAPQGQNGPVGVTLYSAAAGGGRENGLLVSDAVSGPDVGNSCGWQTLDDVVEAMRSGNTYINVHTNDGIDPTNTGPGDFASGEIRGQIK